MKITKYKKEWNFFDTILEFVPINLIVFQRLFYLHIFVRFGLGKELWWNDVPDGSRVVKLICFEVAIDKDHPDLKFYQFVFFNLLLGMGYYAGTKGK